MGKRKNMLFLMSVCFVFCVLGFVSFGRIAFLDHKRQIWILKETVNARNDNNNFGNVQPSTHLEPTEAKEGFMKIPDGVEDDGLPFN